jgi:hypothetical protein
MNTNESPKKKETVRISKKDLRRLLAENEQQLNHITELQTRLNDLLEENRQLKLKAELPVKPKVADPDPKTDDPNDPDYFPKYDPEPHIYPPLNPNIYFDGSNGLGSGRRFGSNG